MNYQRLKKINIGEITLENKIVKEIYAMYIKDTYSLLADPILHLDVTKILSIGIH